MMLAQLASQSILARSDDAGLIKLAVFAIVVLVWIIGGIAKAIKKSTSGPTPPPVPVPPVVPLVQTGSARKSSSKLPPRMQSLAQPYRPQPAKQRPVRRETVRSTPPNVPTIAPPLIVPAAPPPVPKIARPAKPAASTLTGALNAAAVRKVLSPAVLRSQIALAEVFERPESTR